MTGPADLTGPDKLLASTNRSFLPAFARLQASLFSHPHRPWLLGALQVAALSLGVQAKLLKTHTEAHQVQDLGPSATLRNPHEGFLGISTAFLG